METLGCHEAVRKYWNAVAPHLQARFCHSSLGTKIKIERVGKLEYLDEKIDARGLGSAARGRKAKEVIGSADLVAFMCDGEGRGVGDLDCLCSDEEGDEKISITEYYLNAAEFARVSPFITINKCI